MRHIPPGAKQYLVKNNGNICYEWESITYIWCSDLRNYILGCYLSSAQIPHTWLARRLSIQHQLSSATLLPSARRRFQCDRRRLESDIKEPQLLFCTQQIAYRRSDHCRLHHVYATARWSSAEPHSADRAQFGRPRSRICRQEPNDQRNRSAGRDCWSGSGSADVRRRQAGRTTGGQWCPVRRDHTHKPRTQGFQSTDRHRGILPELGSQAAGLRSRCDRFVQSRASGVVLRGVYYAARATTLSCAAVLERLRWYQAAGVHA